MPPIMMASHQDRSSANNARPSFHVSWQGQQRGSISCMIWKPGGSGIHVEMDIQGTFGALGL